MGGEIIFKPLQNVWYGNATIVFTVIRRFMIKVENNFVIFFNSFQILKNHEILLQNFAQTAMHKLLTNGKNNKTEVRSKREKT